MAVLFTILEAPVVRGSGDAPNIVWLDIETRKVAAPESWGYRMRWETFMVGLGVLSNGVARVTLLDGDEASLIASLNQILPGMGTIRYGATRDFDRDVLCGHFTNARRARSPEPGGWPHLVLDDFDWLNIHKRMKLMDSHVAANALRERDPIEFSKNVPWMWEHGLLSEVRTHCRIDVLDMIMRDQDCDLNLEIEK
jgi:hypothetical protein